MRLLFDPLNEEKRHLLQSRHGLEQELDVHEVACNQSVGVLPRDKFIEGNPVRGVLGRVGGDANGAEQRGAAPALRLVGPWNAPLWLLRAVVVIAVSDCGRRARAGGR